MKSVSKSVLKAKMLEYFRNIQKSGESLIVTDNNEPVIKITPLKPRRSPDEVFKDVSGKIRYFAPLTQNSSDEWGAE